MLTEVVTQIPANIVPPVQRPSVHIGWVYLRSRGQSLGTGRASAKLGSGPWPRLQVERPELVYADHDLGFVVMRFGLAVGDRVERLDPDFLISRRSGRLNVRGRPPAYFG